MEWGDPTKLKLLEKAQRLGKRVRALEDRTQLHEDLALAWECFLDLNRCRQLGYVTPQPIPLSEVVAWLDLHAVDGDEQRVCFSRLVACADAEAMAHFTRETEKEMDRKSKEVTPGGNVSSRNRRVEGKTRRT